MARGEGNGIEKEEEEGGLESNPRNPRWKSGPFEKPR